jgi:hypothetical protein
MDAERHRRLPRRIGSKLTSSRFTTSVAVVGLYAAVRVWELGASSPRLLPDTIEYQRIADLPLSPAFFSELKPWAVPFLYKVLPGTTAVSVPVAQLLISIGAWLALAFAFARCFASPQLRALAIGLVLAFSCTPLVAQWDGVLLSESLSLSLLALVLACALELVRAPRATKLAALLGSGLLWAATRDANGYAFLLLALGLAYPLWRRQRPFALALLAGTAAILALSLWSASSPRRWELLVIDAVDQRVLADPNATAYFHQRGMPLQPDLRHELYASRRPLSRFDRDPQLRPFRTWLRRSGRQTYAHYLLSHPRTALRQPLGRIGLLLSPVGLDFYRPTRFRTLLPRPLERLLFPRSGRNTVLWLALAAAGALGLGRAPRKDRLVPFTAAAIVIPLSVLIWDGEPREVSRHELIPTVLTRLSLLAIGLLILEALLPRLTAARSTIRPTSSTRAD